MIIAVDFDGTIVQHRYPEIGRPVPGAIKWLRQFHRAGARLVLWTCRCNPTNDNEFSRACEWITSRNLGFVGFNDHSWRHSLSSKINATVYIDDHGFGVPLIWPSNHHRPYVDWSIVGPQVLEKIQIGERR